MRSGFFAKGLSIPEWKGIDKEKTDVHRLGIFACNYITKCYSLIDNTSRIE